MYILHHLDVDGEVAGTTLESYLVLLEHIIILLLDPCLPPPLIPIQPHLTNTKTDTMGRYIDSTGLRPSGV